MIQQRKFLGISLARRSRRRTLVAGFWIMGFSFAVFAPFLFRGHPRQFSWVFLPFLAQAALLGGEGRKGLVRDFHGHTPDNEPVDYSFMTPEDIAARKEAEKQNRLDEREARARDAAHYKAFELLRWSVPLVAFAAFTEPFIGFAYVRQALLLLVVLVIQALPQSILLWTEPDMEEEG
jgi:hypothetical protein